MRTTKIGLSVFVLALAAASAPPASAQQSDDARICAPATTRDSAAGLAACTRRIESAGLQGRALAEALMHRDERYVELNERARAMQDLDRAVATAPDWSEAYTARAMLALFLHDYQRALADLDRVIT